MSSCRLQQFSGPSRLAARVPSLRPIRVAAVACGLAALAFGGCAQSPQQLAASHGKEYFPESTYGRASRRVIADGQPVPHGGGQYLVGKPYTVAGQTYYPSERHIVQVGNASWYGDAFHGRLTANGEIYDRDGFTAAHPTMPLPSYARVTNLRNNASMIVRVNDRGPYASNRIMDVSRRVAEALDFKRYGTARVKVEYVGRASLAGSDDAKLLATLRMDGPARLMDNPTLVAEATAAPVVAAIESLAPPAPFVAPPPPRRRVVAPIVEPEPRPERMARDVRRPDAVEAAYHRYGVVREARQETRQEPRRELRPEPPPRWGARPDAVEAAYRRYGIARADPMPPARGYGRPVEREPRQVRLALRDASPHLPIRDLLPPPRFDRAERTREGRATLPPSRPSELSAYPIPRHRVVEARATRWRDE